MAGEYSNLLKDEFPVGLRILAVDDDLTCLKLLESLLLRCQYIVTTTTRAVTALKLVREKKDEFDLVISDVHMPEMDGFKLLELVGLETDLPVIMMSANGESQAVMKGVTRGACDYLLKPVRLQELRNIWQHVVRRRKLAEQQIKRANDEEDSKGCLVADSEAFRWLDDRCWELNKKQMDDDQEADEVEDCSQENEESSSQKKPRVVWSIELHQKFVAAVNQLGIDKAVPKKILDLMTVENLTRENVASHLQKYRLYLKRLNAVAGHHASVASSSLRFKNLSFVNMDSLDLFRNYHTVGRSRQLPALAALQTNQLLDRMDSPSLNGMHMASQVAELGHMNHGTGSSIYELGNQQDIRFARNGQEILPYGMPTSFESGQLQQPKASHEANSSSYSCSIPSGNTFANVANDPSPQQTNLQHLEHGGLGNYSSSLAPSLSTDPFGVDLQDLCQFPHIYMPNEAWQYDVPPIEHSDDMLPGFASFENRDITDHHTVADNSLNAQQGNIIFECLISAAETSLADAQDQTNSFDASMITLPSGNYQHPEFPDMRNITNSQLDWQPTADRNSIFGSSSFTSLLNIGADGIKYHYQTSEDGLNNKRMNVDEAAQKTFCDPVLQYPTMADDTTVECLPSYEDEDDLAIIGSCCGKNSPDCDYNDLMIAMTNYEGGHATTLYGSKM